MPDFKKPFSNLLFQVLTDRACGDNTVVEHLPSHPKAEGLSPPSAAGNKRREGKYK